MDYLNGNGSYLFIAKKHKIPSDSQVIRWVAAYKLLGDEGLIRPRKNKKYTFEKKISIVELYLSSEISYQELAIQEGLTNPSLLARWVSQFRKAGPDALRSHKKGRTKTLDTTKPASNKSIKAPVADTNAEYVKELEDGLLKLRIENAFLKEMRRLRLEDEAKMRERLESLAVSEDDSN